MNPNQNLFTKISEPVDENLCFVLMPFKPDLDELYTKTIKPTMNGLGMECKRADEIYSAGVIIDQIWNYIRLSGIIIADLTNRNPNVLYELGLAHASDKKVILLTQSIEDVPFDLRHLRCLVYDNTRHGVEELKHSLIETLKSPQEEIFIPFRVVKKIGNRGSGSGEFNHIRGLAVGKEGRIYVSDRDNYRIQIFTSKFKFEKSFGVKGSEHGQFDGQRGIVIDNDGNVYVADTGNRRIQKFDYAGNFINQFGSEDEQSLLVHPWGLSIDKFGNIYVSSAKSNQIKKFDNKGRFIKKWGGLGKGDGQFYNPLGIAIDKFQNVYVADYGNNRIQKFDHEGSFLLKWGDYRYELGQIIAPHAIAIYDSIIYVTEAANFRIQLFDLNGNYVGTLQTMPENVLNNTCEGLAMDSEGDIYIAKTNEIVKLSRIIS
ncbi:hypothetical protein KA005_45375 [bacterium]|nr:hypothetical protein [bacterium]